MLHAAKVQAVFEINKGLAQGFRMMTQAVQLESKDQGQAQKIREAAASHIKSIVQKPNFADFANHAINVFRDEVGELSATDRFERRYVAPEVDWTVCTVANSNGTDCLLELARSHPNAAEQHLAIQALREELIACCKVVGGLSTSEVAALMTVIEMCNEVHNLDTKQLNKVIDKFVHKLEAEKEAQKHPA